ncbi:hypothetical protein [Bremerella cremea]|uniref:hypothetical protein n=1 Tax=Bremerella cremea TaxID=1031537 RepID=UPI0011C02EE6|nr:hypothetical protein [Bremerella cremea]
MRSPTTIACLTIASVIAILTTPLLAQDPAVLPSERQVRSGDDNMVIAHTYASYSNPTTTIDSPPTVVDKDDYIALAETDASIGALVYAEAFATTDNLCAFGTPDFVPQLEASGTGEYYVDDKYGYAYYGFTSQSYAAFKVVANPSLPAITTGELRGNMHFLVAYSNSGDGNFDPGHLFANISGSSVFYQYDGSSGYYVNVTLENRTGPYVYTSTYVPGKSINDLYVCSRSAAINSSQYLGAKIYHAEGTSSKAGSQESSLSITSWYSIHEIP